VRAIELDAPRPPRSFARETTATLALALPLVAGQVGQMLISVADTMMIGRLGVVPLGAATLANSLTLVPLVFGLGLLTSLPVRVSQARGAGQPLEAAEVLRHGLVLAMLFGAMVVVGFALLAPRLGWLGQPPEVTAQTPVYLMLVAVSLVPALMTAALKNHADALEHPWWPFWIMLGGVGLNVLFNWIFIFGRLGVPAMGLVGAGLATVLARLVVLIAVAVWLLRDRRLTRWLPTRWRLPLERVRFRALLKIGVPASLQQLAEVSAFSGGALFVGLLGTIALGAHQVALTCAATAFMVPLGLAMAVTVRVGEVIGAGHRERLARILGGAWMLIGLFGTLTMVVFIFFGRSIAADFVANQEVVDLAVKLLVVAGLFQLVDGFQVVCAGALRGAGDVVVPAWLCAAAYLGVGVPLGVVLMFVFHLGPVGFWYGLASGLGCAALLLGWRCYRVLLRKT
jgi:MATE family multidrug resistance protein